jgi:3-hydroxyisobutyrate dehydrogenase-like beta-hydroxyacid dehydrogenase
MTRLAPIALVGFGEVGQILAQDLLRTAVGRIAIYDTAFADRASKPSRAVAPPQADDLSVYSMSSHSPLIPAACAPNAVRGARLVISAVTAAQTLEAARSVVTGLSPGAFYLDLNSCAPGQKRAAAEVIEAAGARYVEAAVMSPIGPKRIASPMLLGGPHAAAFAELARPLGFAGAQNVSDQIGHASAIKMCRSVIIKGIEALLTESMLTARYYGVEQVVLTSLSDLLPLPDWNETAQYMIARSLEHGLRRAEEMREAARTVEQAGVAPTMSRAIAERQDWAAGHRGALSPDLGAMLDAIIRDGAE